MHEAVIAIAREGVSPVVRIAANEAWMVKRTLSSICIGNNALVVHVKIDHMFPALYLYCG